MEFESSHHSLLDMIESKVSPFSQVLSSEQVRHDRFPTPGGVLSLFATHYSG